MNDVQLGGDDADEDRHQEDELARRIDVLRRVPLGVGKAVLTCRFIELAQVGVLRREAAEGRVEVPGLRVVEPELVLEAVAGIADAVLAPIQRVLVAEVPQASQR